MENIKLDFISWKHSLNLKMALECFMYYLETKLSYMETNSEY